MTIHVQIAVGTDEEAEAVRQLVQELDPDCHTSGPGGVGVDPIAWVAISMPFSIFVKRFLDLAAEDSYRALKAWLARIVAARRQPPNDVVLRDLESGRHIRLDADLPDEAYRQLLNLRPDASVPGDPISYDRNRRAWTAPI
jgi:hypothetical protein